MYVPAHFRESNLATLLDVIEQFSFGLLVSQVDGIPFASHLPLLVDRQSGPHGALVGHMARANPQWQSAAGEVLAVFSGPHAYISPTWYEAENVVPTWNYVAVHAYGTFQLIDDRQAVLDIVRNYVDYYERSMPNPWKVGETNEFLNKMASAIVGFRIEITRLEGKFKLNQNHPAERRAKVVHALEQRADENSQAIAALIAECGARNAD